MRIFEKVLSNIGMIHPTNELLLIWLLLSRKANRRGASVVYRGVDLDGFGKISLWRYLHLVGQCLVKVKQFMQIVDYCFPNSSLMAIPIFSNVMGFFIYWPAPNFWASHRGHYACVVSTYHRRLEAKARLESCRHKFLKIRVKELLFMWRFHHISKLHGYWQK